MLQKVMPYQLEIKEEKEKTQILCINVPSMRGKRKDKRIYFKPYNIKYRLKSFKFTTFNNQSNKIKKEARQKTKRSKLSF